MQMGLAFLIWELGQALHACRELPIKEKMLKEAFMCPGVDVLGIHVFYFQFWLGDDSHESRCSFYRYYTLCQVSEYRHMIYYKQSLGTSWTAKSQSALSLLMPNQTKAWIASLFSCFKVSDQFQVFCYWCINMPWNYDKSWADYWVVACVP